MSELQLGVAKVDVTPKGPVPLAGFAHRSGPYQSVIRPIYARVMAFRQGDQQALIISADLIWWGSDRVPLLKERIVREWGIPSGSILFHSTHSHSGPQTSTCFTASIGKPHHPYLLYLEEQVLQGIRQAMINMEAVNVGSNSGKYTMGIHRRRWRDGKMVMAPNPDGPIDPELTMICFRRATTSELKAVAVHYTCHPTTTADSDLSSEYCGYAMAQIECSVGGVAVFLQGCCGDIRPALIKEGEFYRGKDEDVRRLGGGLAEEVLKQLQQEMKGHVPMLTKGASRRLPLSFERIPTVEELRSQIGAPGISGEWARRLLTKPISKVDLEMTLLTITDQLSLLSFNSEMVVEYGLFIKQNFPWILPLPYTNGMVGYIPTQQQLAEGGYEALDSTPYFGLPSRFRPSIEQEIKDQIWHLVRKEHVYEFHD